MLDIQGRLYNNDMIRKYLLPHVGRKVKIKNNLGRNKYESFDAEIVSVYNCLFLVKLNDNTIKSFSFSDIIMKKIKLS